MNPEELQARVDDLFSDAVNLSAIRQSTFLDRACSGDPPEVRREVDSLLHAFDR